MKEKKGLPKIIKIILISIVCVIAVFGIICSIDVYRYVSNVPKITLRQSTYEIPSMTTIVPGDLVDIECNGEYKAWFLLLDGDTNGLKLSEDKTSLYVGDDKGVIHLQVIARGLHSEGRESDTIEISVIPPTSD